MNITVRDINRNIRSKLEISKPKNQKPNQIKGHNEIIKTTAEQTILR